MKPLSAAARLYIGLTALLGTIVLAWSVRAWRPEDSLRCGFYLAGAVLFSQLKVRLPGVTGTLSLNFVFVLIGVIELGLPETLMLAAAGMATQILASTKVRPSLAQILFNLSSVVIAAAGAWATFHAAWLSRLDDTFPVLLFFASLAYFAANTLPVATIIALTESKSVLEVWRSSFLWTSPEHLVGATLAALFHVANVKLGWQMALLTVPTGYLVYRSYRLYLGRLEEEKKHATDLAQMNWRTIEALATAIDAKDNTTHDHLQRVRIYASEIARELSLTEPIQKAVEIASLLHDIGKLAVPEHILSKPARLTPEEFEIMKAHPAVGAAILERVVFPYPVVPIVRAHHEKWDGTGYPNGLSGEAIPIGARILAAVDCLDALASSRQYRRALPLEVAMQKVSAESGRSFDPRVVEILQRRYVELEELTRSAPEPAVRLSMDLKCVKGGAPGAGYEIGADGGEGQEDPEFLSAIEAGRRELQSLLELTSQVGARLGREEMFSLMAALLGRFLPHDALAVYVCRNETLLPEYVAGEECRRFSELRIPLGQGISGWVAGKRKPIVNGDPTVESHYLADEWPSSSLHAALVVPLEGPTGTLGAVALYHQASEHFRRADLRLLLALNPAIGRIVYHAMHLSRGEAAEADGVPPRKGFILHVDRELGRSRRTAAPLAVLLMELEGLAKVRESFGYLTEERLLRAALGSLRDNCREYDYVCRPGGDFLAMAIPGASQKTVRHRTGELKRLAIEAGQKVCPGVALSVRIAAASFPEDGESAEDLLACAERRARQATYAPSLREAPPRLEAIGQGVQ